MKKSLILQQLDAMLDSSYKNTPEGVIEDRNMEIDHNNAELFRPFLTVYYSPNTFLYFLAKAAKLIQKDCL